MLVPRCVFALHEVCDTEAGRYQLDSVLFRRTADGKPEAIATDGRRLVCCRWEEPDATDYPKIKGCNPQVSNGRFSAIVPRDTCQRVQNLPEAHDRSKPILRYVALSEHQKRGELITIGASDGDEIECIHATPMAGRYPNTESIWSDVAKALSAAPSTYSMAVDPIALANTLRTMDKVAGKARDQTSVVITIATNIDCSGGLRSIDVALLLTMCGAVHDVAAVILPVMQKCDGSKKHLKPGWFPTYESPTDDTSKDA